MNFDLKKETKIYAPNPELEALKNQIVEIKIVELEQKFLSKDKDFFAQIDKSKKYKNGEILKKLKARLDARNPKFATSKKYTKFYTYIKDNSSFIC